MSVLGKNIERDNLIDGFFNKGYACDLDEVYEAVIGTIKDLEEANDNKIKQITQLTNNWNELEEYVEIRLMSIPDDICTNEVEEARRTTKIAVYQVILGKIKEIKGDNNE